MPFTGYPADPAAYWADRVFDTWTPQVWDVLQRYRVPIQFHLRYGRDFGTPPPDGQLDGDALPILRKANELAIPVFAWVAVPYEDGYWATQDNAPVMAAVTTSLDGWVRDNHLDVAGIVYDWEPPITTGTALAAAASGRYDLNALGVLSEQARSIDPAAQCRAIEQYRLVYETAREHFAQVVGSTWTFALDDLANGDLALQNALSFWGLPPTTHDLYFQAYRSSAATIAGADPGPALVAHYVRQAQRFVGAGRGQPSLGLAGEGSYENLNTLVDDVRLARALGATSIPIYSLETAVVAYGADGLEQLIRAGDNPLDDADVRVAQQPTPQLATYLGIARSLDHAATLATPVVTAARGASQQPNRFPVDCGTG
ncbi:hypothetical protein [Nocardia sp. BMG51109]|uniref:hypothetical protein n=1 Tax=Nocardia sp. BMG51109 TaxID=1056816 RepID=UPI0012EC0479|nr:hypothetical protein [Nocardia sp. BMG51109]